MSALGFEFLLRTPLRRLIVPEVLPPVSKLDRKFSLYDFLSVSEGKFTVWKNYSNRTSNEFRFVDDVDTSESGPKL